MDEEWEGKAHRLWLDTSPRRDPEALQSEIWAPLEASDFALHALLPLENLQIVERYLWPTFSDEASNQHVILIAAFLNVKRQGKLQSWSVLESKLQDFSAFFRRVLSLNLDKSLSLPIRIVLLEFIIAAFQSLEQDIIRKECAPLVSIAIWHNLHSSASREKELQQSTARQKSWKSIQKRFNNSGSDIQVKLQFERAWLYSMIIDFLRRLQTAQITTQEVAYCARFLEFLIDMVSQLPTRRYSIVLLKDLNILSILQLSKMYRREENALIRDLTALYSHFLGLSVDESGTSDQSASKPIDEHYVEVSELQRIAFQHFESKLRVLALSNYAAIDKPGELQAHLSTLSDVELEQLCQLLDLRTSYPASAGITTGRLSFLQMLSTKYARPHNFRQVIQNLSASPTEDALFDSVMLRNESYDGVSPLAVPKLNLQYLSLDDFMWRSFQLQQAESFYEIRNDMEGILRRMRPRTTLDQTTFDGFSKMALAITKPAVVETGPPRVGEIYPSFVRAEVILDVGKVNDRVRNEWESLRPRDVVFLLSAKTRDNSKMLTNGGDTDSARSDLQALRTAEVVFILDDAGKPLKDRQMNGYSRNSNRRRLLLNLDARAFHMDQARLSKTKFDVLGSINVIARRQGRENNFKPVLETIQKLVGTRTVLPSWFQDVFLGYGEPSSASYPKHPDQIKKLDYLDTFLDWQHLQQSFPGRQLLTVNAENSPSPPFMLETSPRSSETPSENPRKRRREQMENDDSNAVPIQVSTYQPPNTGPYPIDDPKKNRVRFTPKQISAIVSGVQPGLSVIVGPPGTGKTDVATQIINLLYHNFPSERILLVAHSNQALNQLFQKIMALDIDARHLLRLGHGEEELDTEASYSKYGRVESFLENRQFYLGEVNRLAASIGAEGAHGSTCETAGYFQEVYVLPAWAKFWSIADAEGASTAAIAEAFPFKKYFSNAPVPDLFPDTVDPSGARDIARGCQHHLDKIFRELESIRPFEILRSPRDQANHLLLKEARIIAMTSTHAAIRRAEIAELGFRYDTLVMEEAAQITEIESFVPCAMQNADSKSGELPLKRIVLVGDHLQNSPVVQNLALRQYANLEQSLFLRLVRLGVPTISLDQQGRCRPSIADLFSWRYEGLTNLPHLTSLPEFAVANAGFRHEFQFIDVPEYQGQGEREPTPHFIQNLGEAEYAVALYQYMRLLGYPAKSISILTTYAGQRALIRDVVEHRCKGNKLFGMPKLVTTVDKYQGEQNDYIILSLVRTKSVGYLRDVRRLTVALSRARLGLYVLGRKTLFETCLEMKTAFERLTTKGGGQLELVTGEMFPTKRPVDGAENARTVVMEGVEHLGQYVYEMTQAKVKSMGGATNIIDTAEATIDDEGDVDEIPENEADLEEDPLHETVR